MLLLVLLLSFALRFWDIGVLPNGLHWDEMDSGFQASSLFQTGRDYFGNSLPLFPHSFADYRTPVFIYSAVPFVAKLGLSAASVRLPALVWGLLAITALYLLTRLLFRSSLTAVFSSLFLSVSLWHLIYSRKSVETGSLFTLVTISVTLFLRGLRRTSCLILSGIFFALASATYSPGKLFVPLLVASLILIYRRPLFVLPKKLLILAFTIYSLLSLPVYWDSFFGQSGLRFANLSIFSDPTIPSKVDRDRLEFALSSGRSKTVGMSPGLAERLLYNKPVEWIGRVAANYLRTFSTNFLFLTGDPELRHSPGKDTIGMLPLAFIIPILIGIFYIFKNLQPATYNLQLILIWLLLAPLPAALTRDGGTHAARLLILLPALLLVSIAGLKFVRQKSPVLLALLGLLLVVSTISDLAYFFTRYRFESARPYQWGYDQVIESALRYSPNYDRVIVDLKDDSALMAYLFYTPIEPVDFQALLPLADVTLSDRLENARQFANLYFLHPGSRRWTDIRLPGRNLIISASDQPLLDTLQPKLNSIEYPDSSPAFYLFEKNQ